MMIIGCDNHPGVQQIAWVDTDTGEFQEARLQHREPAERFYRELALRGVQVRVGMEASGEARSFERLLAELQMELWHRQSLYQGIEPAFRFYGALVGYGSPLKGKAAGGHSSTHCYALPAPTAKVLTSSGGEGAGCVGLRDQLRIGRSIR